MNINTDDLHLDINEDYSPLSPNHEIINNDSNNI